jgi:hypothetical protein
MDKVVLDGVEYVKASAVAKQFHYTSDYVGQLCRAKKIDARLVGRTWFVRPDSIKEHKSATQNKATGPTTNSQTSKEVSDDDSASKVKINRLDVNAPLKNKTAKSTALHTGDRLVSVRSEHESASAISYHSDAETLLPNLNLNDKTKPATQRDRPAPSSVKKFLHIEPASAKKLKITRDKKKQVSFSSTDLPDVALSGKLSVSAYNDVVNEPTEKSDPNETVAAAIHRAKSIEDSRVSMSIEHDSPSQHDSAEAGVPEREPAVFENAPPASLWIRIMPLLATLLAVALSALLLSLVSEITVSKEISTSNLSLQIEQFSQLFVQ